MKIAIDHAEEHLTINGKEDKTAGHDGVRSQNARKVVAVHPS
jgi:hypothetical protein